MTPFEQLLAATIEAKGLLQNFPGIEYVNMKPIFNLTRDEIYKACSRYGCKPENDIVEPDKYPISRTRACITIKGKTGEATIHITNLPNNIII